jgi:hypothetical protein
MYIIIIILSQIICKIVNIYVFYWNRILIFYFIISNTNKKIIIDIKISFQRKKI